MISGQPEILFAGQVNATRGIEASLARLEQIFPTPFDLVLATHNKISDELKNHPRVLSVGGLDRSELNALAATCDYGLVSLSKDFDGPGLPSKSFDYLKMSLPCLYYGPKLPHFLEALERHQVGLSLAGQQSDLMERLDRLNKKELVGRDAFFAEFIASRQSVLEMIA